MLLRFITLLAVGFSFAACSNPREQAQAVLQKSTGSDLRAEAAKVYKEHRKNASTDFIALKSPVWPESFKKFKPLRIGVYRDGVALALEGDASSERGIHIVPTGMELAPPSGRVKYERLEDGIYWYALGR